MKKQPTKQKKPEAGGRNASVEEIAKILSSAIVRLLKTRPPIRKE